MDFNNPTSSPAAKPKGRPAKKKTEWKGEWDHKLSKYVGTGDYEGQDRPQDHAPIWWQKSNTISGDRYLEAYAEATYYQDILKAFWFATEAQIKSAHDLVNEWADDNGIERIRKKAVRKARVSKKTAAKMFELGILKNKK